MDVLVKTPKFMSSLESDGKIPELLMGIPISRGRFVPPLRSFATGLADAKLVIRGVHEG